MPSLSVAQLGCTAVDNLDLEFVRSQFPAFSEASLTGWRFFENAGGSYACRQTIEALTDYYRALKVQPYHGYPAAQRAGAAMDHSVTRWAEALGVAVDEVHFGPSTSMNTYVLSAALRANLSNDAEVIVTNQDHEANTGAIRRAASAAGARIVEWAVDAETGLLDSEDLGRLLTDRTAVVTFPHASNIAGTENDVAELTAMCHEAGARAIVDGVSFVPHSVPNVNEIGADAYLFSLYKVYSVHQGVMTVRRDWLDELPNQGHFFNASLPAKRLTPAGPDHAQVAASGAVLDYIEATARHHGVAGSLSESCERVSRMWRTHEAAILQPLLDWLSQHPRVRLIGAPQQGRGHRCPTVAFDVAGRSPDAIVAALAEHRIMAGAGHFYAKRLIEGLGLDGERGVVRLSFVHYTARQDVEAAISALEQILD